MSIRVFFVDVRPPLFITQDAYQTISEMQSSKGLALADLLGELALLLGGLQLPKNARIYLLSELADLEHRLSQVMDDRLQLGALVGVFAIARDMMKDT